MLHDYLANHRYYDPAYKFFSNFATAYEPLANSMDVSIHPLGTAGGKGDVNREVWEVQCKTLNQVHFRSCSRGCAGKEGYLCEC